MNHLNKKRHGQVIKRGEGLMSVISSKSSCIYWGLDNLDNQTDAVRVDPKIWRLKPTQRFKNIGHDYFPSELIEPKSSPTQRRVLQTTTKGMLWRAWEGSLQLQPDSEVR